VVLFKALWLGSASVGAIYVAVVADGATPSLRELTSPSRVQLLPPGDSDYHQFSVSLCARRQRVRLCFSLPSWCSGNERDQCILFNDESACPLSTSLIMLVSTLVSPSAIDIMTARELCFDFLSRDHDTVWHAHVHTSSYQRLKCSLITLYSLYFDNYTQKSTLGPYRFGKNLPGLYLLVQHDFHQAWNSVAVSHRLFGASCLD
jgi:hypothetical protein